MPWYGGNRPDTAVLDPFEPDALTAVLAELGDRAASGEPTDQLRSELFQRLWPWARNAAERWVWRLPAHADGNEFRSRILDAVWRACQSLDPSQSDGWPALLQIKLRGARADAARQDDRLSRRDRCRVALARLDTVAVADVDPLIEAAKYPRSLDAIADVVDCRWDPEREALHAEVSTALEEWMRRDLPEALADRLVAWWRRTGGERPMPATLARLLEPYLFRLGPLFDVVAS